MVVTLGFKQHVKKLNSVISKTMYEYKEAVTDMAHRLKAYRSVAIISHVRPDADAIGSQIAMAKWLKSFGTDVLCHNDDTIPANIQWLADIEPIEFYTESELQSCDAFLFVDGNTPERFGENAAFFRNSKKPAFVIDHHPMPDANFFKAMVSIPEAGSTAELVFYLYQLTKPDLVNTEVASALYTGIMTDTGSFRFDSVGPHTHMIVSELIRKGRLNVAKIHERIYDIMTENQLKLISRALGQISFDPKTKLSLMYITEKDLEDTGCTHEDTEGLINYPLSLKDTKIAILFSERRNKVKLSLRSKSDFNVNTLARFFDGGGHAKAAGAWHTGPIENAVEEVSEKVRELLKE